jgi:hypothetical protein
VVCREGHMQDITCADFRTWALAHGYTPQTLAPHVQADHPERTAERILFHLAGTRWDDERLSYPGLYRLYHGPKGKTAERSESTRQERAEHIRAQFRDARFTPEGYLKDQALMRAVEAAPCITFRQFRDVAKREGCTVERLTAFVKGELDEPKRTMERILKTGPADTVIPYTCLIQLYEKATAIPQARPGEKSCSCGCGGKIRGKQRFARSACQRRAHRQRTVA